MGHLRVRCPSCAKLYEVDDALIFSSSPHFQCVSCATEFTFDFPPADPQGVEARRVQPLAPAAALPAAAPETAAPAPRVKPVLARRWRDVLNHYTDEGRHQAFVMACRESGDLDFAREKYEDMRRLQGQDDIAERFLARITGLVTIAAEPAPAKPPTLGRRIMATLRRWRPAIIASPFAVSGVLILWGLSHPDQRNMVGAGIAAALLSSGLMAGWPSQPRPLR